MIKFKALNKNAFYDRNNVLYLTGISEKSFSTLGSIQLKLLGFSTEFHVVSNDFSIEEDGIIGVNFLSQTQAKIN